MQEFRKQVLSHFKCQQSGNCCKCPGTVYVTPEELEGMSKILDEPVLNFREKYIQKRNGWDTVANPDFRPDCFLDEDNRCKVYGSRPKHCRTYPDWDELWVSRDVIESEAEVCPGLRKALSIVRGL
jgi:uncharacterized protein